MHIDDNRKILIMDENENTRLGLRLLLHEVTEASRLIEIDNAYTALRHIQEGEPFGLIFTSYEFFAGVAAMKFLWAIRAWQHPPHLYLITNTYGNNKSAESFLAAKGSIVLSSSPQAIKNHLTEIIQQAALYTT